MTTTVATPSTTERNWWVIDAEDLVLGRVSTIAANMLRGKHKPSFTPFIDCGDSIIIINADKVQLTGRKMEQKEYFWHTGYPGGIKSRTAEKLLGGQHPTRVVEKAIKRMMPRSPMGRTQFKNLYVYAGAEHKHEAQKPQVLDVASLNSKNKRAA